MINISYSAKVKIRFLLVSIGHRPLPVQLLIITFSLFLTFENIYFIQKEKKILIKGTNFYLIVLRL